MITHRLFESSVISASVTGRAAELEWFRGKFANVDPLMYDELNVEALYFPFDIDPNGRVVATLEIVDTVLKVVARTVIMIVPISKA